MYTNFNPRSHKRSDDDHAVNVVNRDISIHAPTRGATFMRLIFSIISTISIHAPTRGATIPVFRLIIKPVISIHAPTRGATSEGCDEPPGWLYFNPRSHKRSDHCRADCCPRCRISIHAPTRGATCSYW